MTFDPVPSPDDDRLGVPARHVRAVSILAILFVLVGATSRTRGDPLFGR